METVNDEKEKQYCDDCGVEMLEGYSSGYQCLDCFRKQQGGGIYRPSLGGSNHDQ